jgi:hypothetical protein
MSDRLPGFSRLRRQLGSLGLVVPEGMARQRHVLMAGAWWFAGAVLIVAWLIALPFLLMGRLLVVFTRRRRAPTT